MAAAAAAAEAADVVAGIAVLAAVYSVADMVAVDDSAVTESLHRLMVGPVVWVMFPEGYLLLRKWSSLLLAVAGPVYHMRFHILIVTEKYRDRV